jgi:putative redox protein
MTKLSMDWKGDLSFSSSAGFPAMALESSNPEIASPPQALAYATMACMGMDVVHVIEKGRHDLRGLVVRFEGERAADYPKRFISMAIHFIVTGSVPDHVVERAIELSRTKYCSVWNTLRTDLPLTTSFAIEDR